MASIIADSEVGILNRLIVPEDADLSADVARSILKWKFDPRDTERMRELLAKNQHGQLTADEQKEIERYRHVGHLLDLMHSKARLSLARDQSGA